MKDFVLMICTKHNIKLECMGGRSAHSSNWYCPKCDDDEKRKPSPQEKLTTKHIIDPLGLF